MSRRAVCCRAEDRVRRAADPYPGRSLPEQGPAVAGRWSAASSFHTCLPAAIAAAATSACAPGRVRFTTSSTPSWARLAPGCRGRHAVRGGCFLAAPGPVGAVQDAQIGKGGQVRRYSSLIVPQPTRPRPAARASSCPVPVGPRTAPADRTGRLPGQAVAGEQVTLSATASIMSVAHASSSTTFHSTDGSRPGSPRPATSRSRPPSWGRPGDRAVLECSSGRGRRAASNSGTAWRRPPPSTCPPPAARPGPADRPALQRGRPRPATTARSHDCGSRAQAMAPRARDLVEFRASARTPSASANRSGGMCGHHRVRADRRVPRNAASPAPERAGVHAADGQAAASRSARRPSGQRYVEGSTPRAEPGQPAKDPAGRRQFLRRCTAAAPADCSAAVPSSRAGLRSAGDSTANNIFRKIIGRLCANVRGGFWVNDFTCLLGFAGAFGPRLFEGRALERNWRCAMTLAAAR